MPFLVLDLDLTVIASKVECHLLDQSTHPHNGKILPGKGAIDHHIFKEVYLINPKKLTALLQSPDYEGIIILTAGFWDKHAIIDLLLNNLSLSPAAKAKINGLTFLAPHTTQNQFPELNLVEIQHLEKNERLNRHIQQTPTLKNKHFVVLDDNYKQVESFKNETHVTAIHATTRKDQITYSHGGNIKRDRFYEWAMQALKLAKNKEQQRAKQSGRKKNAKQTPCRKDSTQTFHQLNEVVDYYPYAMSQRLYHFWNEVKVDDAATKKSDFLSQINKFRGDKLKAAILNRFKNQIDDCASLADLQCCVDDIKKTVEYEILCTSQGLFTSIFHRVKRTDSIKAFEEMVKEKIQFFLELPNLNLMMG